MTRKKSAGRPNKDLKKVRCCSCMPPFLWMALCVLCVAIFWEVLPVFYRQGRQENKTYTYPKYTLDFQAALKKREKLLPQYQRNHKAAKVEKRRNLSLQEFWDLYDAKWPVIITDVVNTWPASKWTSEFLNSTYGTEQVALTLVEGSHIQGLSVPLHGFLRIINMSAPGRWGYITDELFIVKRPELYKQILPSKYTDEDFFKLFPEDIQPWDSLFLWGARHSHSNLHIDPYNWTGTNAVIKGKKKWKLFPPGQDHLLYVDSSHLHNFPLQCRAYKSLAKYIEVEQKAGEILIIPTGWFHQAYNAEETMAISGQLMNRNNYRYVLEEILKVGNLNPRDLPDGFHKLQPQEQVKIFMSLIPQKVLDKGKKLTEDYQKSIQNVGI